MASSPIQGFAFAHPFGQRTGLPVEVPHWLRSDAAEFISPQLCNPTRECAYAFWSAWMLFESDLDLSTSRTLALATMRPHAAQLLAELMRKCFAAVEASMASRMASQANSGVLRERRRRLAQQATMITRLESYRFAQVWAVRRCLRLLLAVLRSMVLNNIKYRICSDPVQVHVVATVGKVMTRGGVVNVYGDFTALQAHGVVPKNCMILVLQVQDSSFSELWKEIYELHGKGELLESAIALNRYRLWELGQTFAVLLHETLYDSEGRPAPPDVFTAKSTLRPAAGVTDKI
ncbi:unnamed protein product [Effrenium voratum]|nr:unnamed protein product [Effrenium voratum]